MARYVRDDDSNSSKMLLIAAGVVVGVTAGAVVAHKLGGWKGISRRLRRRRGPLNELLQSVVSPQLLSRLLGGGGGAGVLSALLSASRRRRRRRAGHSHFDPDLDEYEVEEWERAAAGVDQDDHAHAAEDDFEESEREPNAEEIEQEVLEIFSRSRALRRRPIEIACSDDGVVSLRGTVRSPREARLARRLALSVDGVESVDAELEVREPQAS